MAPASLAGFGERKKYPVKIREYVSCPAPEKLSTNYGETDYLRNCTLLKNTITPISICIFLPATDGACPSRSRRVIINPYLQALYREMESLGKVHGNRRVRQLCLISRTLLEPADLTELMHQLATNFRLEDSDTNDFSITLNPRDVNLLNIALIKGLGFNHIDLEIGDFYPQVLGGGDDCLSYESVKALITAMRPFQFLSIGVELYIGLPGQSIEKIEISLRQVLRLRPDRISCFEWTEISPVIRGKDPLDTADLPNEQRYQTTISYVTQSLLEAGYIFDGMNQFTLDKSEPEKENKHIASRAGFQGDPASRTYDLVGLGQAAISRLGDNFFQNEVDLDCYISRIKKGELPIARGKRLFPIDRLRDKIIQSLCLRLQLDLVSIEKEFCFHFEELFLRQLEDLRQFESLGLVYWQGRILHIRHTDRRALRAICKLFDDCRLATRLSSFSKLF